MKTLDTIRLSNDKRIELCVGDLTALPRRAWFDALIVSAFAGGFQPFRGTLIGALDEKGVSVAELAEHKEVDYREHLGTWLSSPFASEAPGIGYDRIICFEPELVGDPPNVVRHLFTALMPILAERPGIRTVAMPVLATGNQGRSVEEMLPAILRAATDAMEHGLPLDRLSIFVHTDRDAPVAQTLFAAEQQRIGQFDVFISYAHRDHDAMEAFHSDLSAKYPDIRIFIDRLSIKSGAAWQQTIFQAMDRCRRIVALLSPAYLESRMCVEEFNIGLMRNRSTGQEILRPIRMREAKLETYMHLVQHIDCVEVDRAKIRAAVDTLASGLS